jgi:hypothetical protein
MPSLNNLQEGPRAWCNRSQYDVRKKSPDELLPLGSSARAKGADTHKLNPLIGGENPRQSILAGKGQLPGSFKAATRRGSD